MAKIVTYKGSSGTNKYEYPELVKGENYWVETIRDEGNHIVYTLKNKPGRYYDVRLFEEFRESKPTFTAIAAHPPKVGQCYECYKLQRVRRYVGVNDSIKYIEWTTSTVEKIYYISNNVYKVVTSNSIYIVTVLV